MVVEMDSCQGMLIYLLACDLVYEPMEAHFTWHWFVGDCDGGIWYLFQVGRRCFNWCWWFDCHTRFMHILIIFIFLFFLFCYIFRIDYLQLACRALLIPILSAVFLVVLCVFGGERVLTGLWEKYSCAAWKCGAFFWKSARGIWFATWS